MSVNMFVLGNPARSFSILIGSIPSDPLYVLSANQQRLYERCYTSASRGSETRSALRRLRNRIRRPNQKLKPEVRHVLRPGAMLNGPT